MLKGLCYMLKVLLQVSEWFADGFEKIGWNVMVRACAHSTCLLLLCNLRPLWPFATVPAVLSILFAAAAVPSFAAAAVPSFAAAAVPLFAAAVPLFTAAYVSVIQSLWVSG